MALDPHDFPSPAPSTSSVDLPDLDEEFGRTLTNAEFRAMQDQLATKPVIETFPSNLGTPGAPISTHHGHAYEKDRDALDSDARGNPWAPFASQLDWEVARWAKLRGPSSTALTELLKIPEVWSTTFSACSFSYSFQLRERLGLSFKTAKELNTIIDRDLPGRPAFQHHSVDFGGHTYDVFFRDIISCLKALWSDPELSPYLILAPERHYADKDKTIRLYFDMHTGKWWWRTQVRHDSLFLSLHSVFA